MEADVDTSINIIGLRKALIPVDQCLTMVVLLKLFISVGHGLNRRSEKTFFI